jgi:hypothetical protein
MAAAETARRMLRFGARSDISSISRDASFGAALFWSLSK